MEKSYYSFPHNSIEFNNYKIKANYYRKNNI